MLARAQTIEDRADGLQRRGESSLGLLPRGVDLHEHIAHQAGHIGAALERVGDVRAVHAVDQLGERDHVTGLVGLESADEVPWHPVVHEQRIGVLGDLLSPVLPHGDLPAALPQHLDRRGDLLRRARLGGQQQGDRPTIAPAALCGVVEAREHPVEAGGELIGGGGVCGHALHCGPERVVPGNRAGPAPWTVPLLGPVGFPGPVRLHDLIGFRSGNLVPPAGLEPALCRF